eukprot:gene6696-4794_t
MSADSSTHRKVAVHEWTDTATAAGKGAAPAQPALSGQVKEFFGGAMACGDKKAYIVGGYDPKAQRSIRQVVEFAIAPRQWSRQPDIPERLSRAAAVAFEDYCIVFGGWDDVGFSNKLWLLVPVPVAEPGQGGAGAGAAGTGKGKDLQYTYHWECLPPSGTSTEDPKETPCARVGHSFVLGQVSSTVPGEKRPSSEPVAYLFGGFDGRRRLNDVWRLSVRKTIETKEAVWERLEFRGGVPPSPRDEAAVAFAANAEKLYVFGGYAQSLCNDLNVLELKDGKNQWTDLPVQGAPTRRQGSIAAADDQHLIVCMGTTEDHQSIPQLIQVSFKDYKWKLLAVDQCMEALSDRSGYVGCCGNGNKRLLIYGGGRVPFHASMVEIELERSEAVSKKKQAGGPLPLQGTEALLKRLDLSSASWWMIHQCTHSFLVFLLLFFSLPSVLEVTSRSHRSHSHAAVLDSANTCVDQPTRHQKLISIISSPTRSMDENPPCRKRRGEELTADTNVEDDRSGDDGFATSPQLATPEEMAKRRILRGKRPATTGTSGTAGLFKNIRVVGAPPPPEAAAPAFGSTANTNASAKTPAFSFGTFGAAPAAASSSSSSHPTPPAPVFPKGAFSFANAAASFVEARKNAESANTEGGATGDAATADEVDDAQQALQSNSVIRPTPGEVLIAAPTKLYGFDKTEKKWVERGAGDVKIKKEKTSAAEGEAKEGQERVVYRLLVRDGYSLNTVIAKNVFLLTSTQKAHILFTTGTPEGPAHYLLKFVGAQAEENLSKFIQRLKEVQKEVGITEA